jgi:transposase, IS5 family
MGVAAHDDFDRRPVGSDATNDMARHQRIAGKPAIEVLFERFDAALTDAARYDGALLPELIDPHNTASDAWADTAYCSKANEAFLAGRLLRSQIHRKKPMGKPMPHNTARANARKSAVRAAVEHVFARQKGPMGLFIRTIGIVRARTKVGLATLLFNMQRMV